MMKVILYSTPTCMYCKMTKDFFDRNNVSYTEYNVAEDMKARDEMVQKSYQLGVPVIDIDNEIFVGFNRKELENSLGIG